MKYFLHIFLALIFLFPAKNTAAQTKSYPNVSQFFQKNTYGTMAFVWGVRKSDDIPNGPFVPIDEGVIFEIPAQQAYCIAIQHFGGNPAGASHKYTINFFAEDIRTGVKTPVHLGYTRSYDITPVASGDMPSYCFRRRSRTRFWIEVTSTDRDWLDGSYELIVRPS